MKSFTFVVRINQEPYEGLEMQFPSAPAAVEAGRAVLQGKVDFYPKNLPPVVQASVGVGQGSLVSDRAVLWLGEWEWGEEEADWDWTASP
jgi:hypothetical protein